MTVQEILNLVSQLGEALANLSGDDLKLVEAAIENELGTKRLHDKLQGRA